MSNAIDCSRMSHAACQVTEPDHPPPAPPSSTAPVIDARAATQGLDYECLNHCISSLGVVSLVNSSLTALGCAALPPACPVFIGTAAGAIVGACASACDEL